MPLWHPWVHMWGTRRASDVLGADLLPFQSLKFHFSSEKLWRPTLRQGLDCSADVETMGMVFGKRKFFLGGQEREDYGCSRDSMILRGSPQRATPAMDFSQKSVLALAALCIGQGPQVFLQKLRLASWSLALSGAPSPSTA